MMIRKMSISLAVVSALIFIQAMFWSWQQPFKLAQWFNQMKDQKTVVQSVNEMEQISPLPLDNNLSFAEQPTNSLPSHKAKTDRKHNISSKTPEKVNVQSPKEIEQTSDKPHFPMSYLEDWVSSPISPNKIPIAPGYQSPVVYVDNNTGNRVFIYPKEIISRINPIDFAYSCYLIVTNFTWEERQRLYELTIGEIDAADRAEVIAILSHKLTPSQVNHLYHLAVKYGFIPDEPGN